MSASIKQLNAAVAIDQEQRAARDRAATQASRERLVPLEERVARSLKTVPAEIQREGLSLASLQASLRGRWRGNCHPGELGSALRKLGFTRQPSVTTPYASIAARCTKSWPCRTDEPIPST
jgi:hypothetical protein